MDGKNVSFETDEHVEANEELAYEIVRRVFLVNAGFLSDGSTLSDFINSDERNVAFHRQPLPDDVRTLAEAHKRIEEEFGIDVQPEDRIWRIAELIAAARPRA